MLAYDGSEVESVLEHFLPGCAWEIRRPETGWRKASYVACSGDVKLFIKFDVPAALLSRLGDIGVAPRVVFAGNHGGTDFVIQEFINGIRPQSRAWMRQHAVELAAIIKTYHEDAVLRRQLAAIFPEDGREHLARDLSWLTGRFSQCGAAYLKTKAVLSGFRRLAAASKHLALDPLVPIHDDPSPTNMLLADGKLVFLDWDEITLSDPMRDIGLILWWNFQPEQWPLFFERLNSEFTGIHRAKTYWFAARASLDIALWHAEHGLDGSSFADDFLAAVNEDPNPQGY
jgi:aminoglycoside phosphotransferase (APT) family kinase protein